MRSRPTRLKIQSLPQSESWLDEMRKMSRRQRPNPWFSELDDLVRGAAGGFLFGIPLIYTMEVWWIGSSVKMARLFLAIVLTFAIVFMLNRTAGFRKIGDSNAGDAAKDTVEAMAIGFICTGLVMIVLQEINLDTPLSEALGKLIYESMPFTLGVALANQFLSGSESAEDQSDASTSQQKPSSESSNHSASHLKNGTLNATLSDIGATSIGAVIVALSIAPTDEVPMLAGAVRGLWLLVVMATSLLVSYAIVFQAGFANQQKRHQQQGIFQRPTSETVMSYLISLLAAALMLAFFDRLHWRDPWQVWLSHTILLGLPATVGGAAGRLAI